MSDRWGSDDPQKTGEGWTAQAPPGLAGGLGGLAPYPAPAWPPAPPVKPREVELAFRLWIATIVLGLVGSALVFTFSDPLDQARARAESSGAGTINPAQFSSFLNAVLVVTAILGVIFLVLEVFFVLKMRAGRNWARITLTIFAAISVASTLFSLVQGAPGITVVTGPVGVVLQVTATVLLYRRASNAYFSVQR